MNTIASFLVDVFGTAVLAGFVALGAVDTDETHVADIAAQTIRPRTAAEHESSST